MAFVSIQAPSEMHLFKLPRLSQAYYHNFVSFSPNVSVLTLSNFTLSVSLVEKNLLG